MAGLIKREDVELVRERVRIEEVVGERVALKPAGAGSLRGLCPFHDERTPSFHVRPALGLWHCFGCGEGGDVIAFLRKADALSFTETIEYLAGRLGIALHYESSGGERNRGPDTAARSRLIEANRLAARFFEDALASPEARAGRDFLRSRGFDREVAAKYGVGYAPNSWDAVLRHLRGSGMTEAEIAGAGLVSQNQRGYFDRFRGRLVWPIRDLTGSVIGFGARRLDDSDTGPKYLNTPETSIYHKSHVLYGVDLAKREIGRQRQAVIVEGYTDVMAAHLAGVPTAVATCGTAFGEDHVRVLRRLLGDAAGSAVPGRVVFTFDGDEAGRKAALRAFEQDQAFFADTFVAVAPDGMDPCELRQERGDDSVRRLVDQAVPLFKFAIQTVLAQLNLDAPEGRVAGLRYAAPVVARLRDTDLRAEYGRLLAGWLGLPEAQVKSEVHRLTRGGGGARQGGRPAGRVDPVSRLEYGVLAAVLQAPEVAPADFDNLDADAFSTPEFRAIHDAIRAAGGVAAAHDSAARGSWLDRVRQAAPSVVEGRLTEMAVAPLPVTEAAGSAALPGEEVDKRRDYVHGLVNRLTEVVVGRQIAEVRARLGRLAATGELAEQAQLQTKLLALEGERHRLRQVT